MNSNVKLRANWAAASVMIEAAADALAATGKDIAERTREHMVPGYFYDTGLSQDQTRYEQLTDTSGQVHIPTEYAGYAELGTVHMAPRPALTPAVDECWPNKMIGHWSAARRGQIDRRPDPAPATDPIGRPGSIP